MNRIARTAGQFGVAAAVMALIGVFANGPGYRHFPADHAMVMLSLSQASQHKDACRQRSAEELAKLSPNMRGAQKCGRERVPVLVELAVDDRVVFSKWRNPSGFSADGAATFYEKFPVLAGRHHLAVRMRDSGRAEGFDYSFEREVEIGPLEIVVVDFRSEAKEFTLE